MGKSFNDILDEWEGRSRAGGSPKGAKAAPAGKPASPGKPASVAKSDSGGKTGGFGDILSAWDEMQSSPRGGSARSNVGADGRQISRKKANAPTAEEKEAVAARKSAEDLMREASERRINPMELWLRRYGTTDKDAELDLYNERARMESREYLRTMRAEARIDLHGLTREEAWARLEAFTAECVGRGLRKILIVHGKGNHSHGSDPVLGPMVRTFIEQSPCMGTSGHPDHAQGGSGATWVILKADS